MSAGKLVGIDLDDVFGHRHARRPRQASRCPTATVRAHAQRRAHRDGSAVVARRRRDVALDMPERGAMLIKRSMGQQKFEHPVLGREFRPKTLSAIILRKLVQDASCASAR